MIWSIDFKLTTIANEDDKSFISIYMLREFVLCQREFLFCQSEVKSVVCFMCASKSNVSHFPVTFKVGIFISNNQSIHCPCPRSVSDLHPLLCESDKLLFGEKPISAILSGPLKIIFFSFYKLSLINDFYQRLSLLYAICLIK